MAISSPSPSTISPSSLTYTRSKPSHSLQFPCSSTITSRSNRSFPSLTVSCCKQSPKPLNTTTPNRSSNINGSVDLNYEFHHETPIPRWHKGSMVYVTLPIDIFDSSRRIKKLKAMSYSFQALALGGVKGVVMEVWWGLVESDAPLIYDWRGYLEIVELARRFRLKVRAVLAFHELGVVGDSCWVPLPYWVRMAMLEEPEMAYSDRFGRRSGEYISLGCDTLPVLRGRSPLQAYSDFMRSFRDTFKDYLGVTITGVQVGMGPGGELRYPSCPSRKLEWGWRFRELGEFQCYDKYMIASLNACAQEIGKPEWGNGGPLGTANLTHNHEATEFFKSSGSWNTPYGKFFLEWYSGMLLLHGERLCIAAENVFWGTGVSISAKLAGIHWHYGTESHPSELTAGYYNTSIRNGYLPIASMFRRYGMILCCSCFELRDSDEKLVHPFSSPERLLKRILFAARESDLPLDGENSVPRVSQKSLEQVVRMSEFYSDGVDEVFFTFNFMRMGQSLFEQKNWLRFTQFVKQISPGNGAQGKLNLGGGQLSASYTLATAKKARAATVYY